MLTKIGFIGSGIMAETIIKQLLKNKTIKISQIITSDVDKDRLEELEGQLGIETTTNNRILVNQSEVIILAVKPQSFLEVVKSLKNVDVKDKLVLSIMAGINISRIRKSLNTGKIVRIMPNMPAQVGCGMSVWTSTDKVLKSEKNFVKKLLSGLGEEIYVDNENLINSATAISGSGPAYLFLIMQVMYKKTIDLGFDKNQAKKLVIQTVLGSAQIAKLSKQDFQTLQNNVTSKGGTTEVALEILDQGKFSQTFSEAIQAAYQRAQELGR